MKELVTWATKNVIFSMFLILSLTCLGLFAFKNLPIDALPDVTNVQVQVVTKAPSLSASEMETQITQPIERAMAGIPSLKETRSISKLGIAIVTLIFDDDVNVYFARTQVNERLTGVRDQIPSELGKPELAPVTTALGEIYMFELKPTDGYSRSSEELRTMVEWQISPKLRQISGVIEVIGFGGSLKQYRVTLDSQRLSVHGLSAGDVKEALLKDNVVKGGGFIESEGEQIVLRGEARFQGLEDIQDVVVRTSDRGVPVRIGELGEVDTGPALRQGAMTRDARGEIVGASVLMLKGQNSREVVANVKRELAALKPKLPSGVDISPYYDRASFINDVLATVTKNLSEGAIIVVLCLLLTLGSVRAGLLVAGAIPFAMLVGFIGLKLLGYSGNVMSLGAIDFGIVVEGAVLMVEHAMTHAMRHEEREARRKAMVSAMRDVARAVVFGVVITLLVFLPLVTLEDVEGKMFRPVVISLCFMLFGALVYALIFLPVVGPLFLKNARISHVEPWLIRKVRAVYEPLVVRALEFPKTTLAITFGLALLMMASGSNMGAEFLPRIFEGAFALDTTRPPSTSLPLAISLSKEMEETLLESQEVETVVSRIGRPEGAVDPAGPESSDVFVILKPKNKWRKGLTVEGLAQELSSKLEKRVPATMAAFSQPIEMRVNDLIAGVKSDVAIKVFGDDLDNMSQIADRIRREIATIPGAADVKMEIAKGLPSIRVRPDRDKLARLGISTSAVLDVLSMSRAGVVVGEIREGERVFDLNLRLGGETIQNENDLSRLPIEKVGGELIPIGVVTEIKREAAVVQISREQMKRRLSVQANVRGRDVVGFVQDAQAKVQKLNLPKSVDVVWGGQFQNFNRAKDKLMVLVPISLAVIAVLLAISFRSFRYMFVTVLSLPFALAGGIMAMSLRQLPFSIPAGVGFIALSGVAVMTGIVMTGELLGLHAMLGAKERVLHAAKASLRAPLSTALVAAVGFIPAAIATGTGAEVQKPLATVVIGGLIVAMALSMFALPVMLYYACLWRESSKNGQKKGSE